MKSFLRGLVWIGSVVAFLALATGSSRAAEGSTAQASLSDGYSLFYDFCNQESELDLLLWVKKTPPDVADFAKRISATAKDDLAILKRFGANDSGLKLDKVSLPDFEVRVRKSMADDRKQQLLWDSSGAGFVQAVCMTQSEATNYGLHVAKILTETEPDPDRAKAMRAIYDKWVALHAEAYKLIR